MPELSGYSGLFVVHYTHSLQVVTLYPDFLLGVKPNCLEDSTHTILTHVLEGLNINILGGLTLTYMPRRPGGLMIEDLRSIHVHK